MKPNFFCIFNLWVNPSLSAGSNDIHFFCPRAEGRGGEGWRLGDMSLINKVDFFLYYALPTKSYRNPNYS